jgi:hypothetical protein
MERTKMKALQFDGDFEEENAQVKALKVRSWRNSQSFEPNLLIARVIY